MDILQTLSEVISDIILDSDKNTGSSTLNLQFKKQVIEGDLKQILTMGIFGEEATTVYPIDVPSQEFKFELLGEIQNADGDRKSLSEGIYNILMRSLKSILDPNTVKPISIFGTEVETNQNVSSFTANWLINVTFFLRRNFMNS